VCAWGCACSDDPVTRCPQKNRDWFGWRKDEIHRPEQEVDAGVGNNEMKSRPLSSAGNEPNSPQVNAQRGMPCRTYLTRPRSRGAEMRIGDRNVTGVPSDACLLKRTKHLWLVANIDMACRNVVSKSL
jgi:hypothetical protein